MARATACVTANPGTFVWKAVSHGPGGSKTYESRTVSHLRLRSEVRAEDCVGNG